MTPPLPIDFQPYLKSLTTNDKYRRRWRLYTPTDAIGEFQPVHEEPGLDLELMVALFQPQQQTDDCSQKSKVNPEEPKNLPVLQGIHQYLAESNHVLLVGRPGLGKSTALLRLLVEQAQEALRDPTAKIPVLLELRYLDAHQPIVLDRISTFLRNHNLNVEAAVLKAALAEGRFLLLIDGVNELPSEAARRAVDCFRQDYSQSQMVFTTRDVALGGDLGIANKLEMQLLSDSQIQQFIRAYLPAQEQSMLQQLRGRARELGKTPLFLEMFCQVFEQLKQIPGSLGLLFQCFVGGYEKLKQSVPTSEGFRYWKADLLKHLAFTMLKAGKPTNLQISIPRLDAEAILAEFLQGKVDYPAQRAKEWLEDLLEHHLIQLIDSHQLEFHHQLIQEYYAAEYLLRCLPQLSDEELKRDYLNYLKWTEPVALMLSLLEDEAQAFRVVRLAMDEVDLMLGARLAGEVKPAFQATTVGWIDQKELPIQLKIQCWGASRSEEAIRGVMEALSHSEWRIRMNAVVALGAIGVEKTVQGLLQALSDSKSDVYRQAVDILGKSSYGLLTQKKWIAFSNADENGSDMVKGEADRELSIKINQQSLIEIKPDEARKSVESIGRVFTEGNMKIVRDKILHTVKNLPNTLLRAFSEGIENIGDPESLADYWQSYYHESEVNYSGYSHSWSWEVINRVQNRCKFYNYKLWQSYLESQKSSPRHSQCDEYGVCDKLIVHTENLNIMTSQQPIFNQQNATIGVNYAASGSKIEVNQGSNSPKKDFDILMADYKQFIEQLQQNNSAVTDISVIPQILEAEVKLIESQDQQRWRNFLDLKRLWNGSKKAGLKVGEHFAENNPWAKAGIAFLEGVSEDVD